MGVVCMAITWIDVSMQLIRLFLLVLILLLMPTLNVLPVWFVFFSSRSRHTRLQGDWGSDVCSSDLYIAEDKPEIWKWPIFPKSFRAPALMALARRQAWTLK